MNAVSDSDSPTDFVQEMSGGSDSDKNIDDLPDYYQPISAGGEDDEDDNSLSDHSSDIDHGSDFHRLPNGFVENGVASLDLSEDEADEEEEDERMRVETDSAMHMAIREDESRRNAPLPAENATRVLEAMRGISFLGSAPEWANQVPEDQWIDQVRRLRRPVTSITSIIQE